MNILKHIIMEKNELSRFDLRDIKLPDISNINEYNLQICSIKVIEKYMFNPLDNCDQINDLIKALNKLPEISKNIIIICVENLNNPNEMINNQIPNKEEQGLLIRFGQAIKNNCIEAKYNNSKIKSC